MNNKVREEVKNKNKKFNKIKLFLENYAENFDKNEQNMGNFLNNGR